MVAKKSVEPVSGSPEVDMDRIKDMMGPLPDEHGGQALPVTKSTKKVSKAKTGSLNAAAEEANATLKAMSPNLGESTITKVDDAEVMEATLGNDPDDTASDEYLTALEEDPLLMLPAEEEEKTVASDTPETEAAVDDIVSKEGDEVLAAEDEKREGKLPEKPVKTGGFKEKLANLWAKKWFRIVLFGTIFLGLLAAALLPASRYFVLNTAGVRASLSANIVDSSTLQPLKNVEVSVAGVNAQTDEDGNVKLEHVRLGSAELVIKKRAFSANSQKITVGWGSNPKGQIRLVATGDQYSFLVTDFLSGKPVEKAQAKSGEGNAVSDKDGKLVLTLDTSANKDTDEISIEVALDQYRTETVKITAATKDVVTVKMVPSKKDVFVSKRTGTYDLYTIDVDGKNEKKIAAGTGIEREDMALSPSQNADVAAYVATRENARNSDGYLLSTLYLVDTKTGTLVKLDQSEQIQLIGWSADQRLVYVKTAAGASAANPKRTRLMSVNTKNVTDSKELANANYFNDVLLAGDTVLYAPSKYLQTQSVGLASVNANGTSAVTVTDKEILNILRTDYETVTLSAQSESYTYKIGAAASSFAPTTSASSINRLYIDNTAGGKSLWIDTRDGKGVLLAYDKASKKDAALVTKSGTKIPMYWLNSTTIVFRLRDNKETANYVVSVNGGDPKKIVDVTDTSGIGRWYYY